VWNAGRADAPATVEQPSEVIGVEPPLFAPLPPPPPVLAPVCPLPATPCCVTPLPPPPPPPIIDPPPPVVTVKVRVPSCAPENNELEYHIYLENCSPAAAHHVLLRNPLPENAKFVRANPEPSQTKGELQWKLGTMYGGERRKIVLVLAPTGTGDVKNCTRVQFEHGQCVTTHVGGMAPPPFIGPFPKPVPVKDKEGKLSLVISGDKKQMINVKTTYKLTVTNTGKITAKTIVVSASLAEKMEYVDSNPKGKFLEGQVVWPIGDLEPGESRSVAVTVKAKAAGNLCIKGRAVADPDLRAADEFCTDFAGVSALSLEMVDTADPIVVGGETTYTIMVENTGSAPATKVQIKAYIPPLMSFREAKGGEFKVGEVTKDGFQTLLFDPLASLAAGAKLELAVTVRATRSGDARFKIDLTADQLERGPVREEESTAIFDEDGPPQPPPPLRGKV
jgi:uncharacterized repeat protein (TIGR01451 family)